MVFTEIEAKKIGKYFKINFKIVPFNEWFDGLNIELEHGTKNGNLTNITNDDIKLTAKIAITHLLENPRYYYFLRKMEKKSDNYWKNLEKPHIFLD